MHEIKSFKIFQTAKVIAVLYTIMFAIMGMFEFALFTHLGKRPPLVLFVVLPVFAAILGFIGAAFLCWLYNLVAARIGGIAFELTPRSEN